MDNDGIVKRYLPTHIWVDPPTSTDGEIMSDKEAVEAIEYVSKHYNCEDAETICIEPYEYPTEEELQAAWEQTWGVKMKKVIQELEAAREACKQQLSRIISWERRN